MSKLTVARFLETMFAQCGKSQAEIARELGYPKPNILTMFKKGHTKVPLEVVGPLANALGADPVFLFKLVMQEYRPDTYTAIEPCLTRGTLITQQEASLLQLMRDSFKGSEIDLTDPRIEASTRKYFEEIADSQAASDAAARDRYDRSPANARDFG